MWSSGSRALKSGESAAQPRSYVHGVSYRGGSNSSRCRPPANMVCLTGLGDSLFFLSSMDLIVLRESLARLMSIASGNESNAVATKQRCSHLIHRTLKTECLLKQNRYQTCLGTGITVKGASTRWLGGGDDKRYERPCEHAVCMQP